jgi:predicted AAA+ superfamily ATPase
MIEEYRFHNQFWNSLSGFSEMDPHLVQLKDLPYVHTLDWWRNLDLNEPGIYILTGGRQIGKSTSTKLLIKHILAERLLSPENLFYLPCDQIDDHHHLARIVRSFLLERVTGKFVLVLDEVTFVSGWDKGVKAMADEGLFRDGVCILTGSDTAILKEAAVRFPGRRGNAAETDFHMHPLTFREYVELVAPSLLTSSEDELHTLFDAFGFYLECGGYLRAINELHAFGNVRDATYLTFEQWIRGDFEKRGKKLSYLLETLSVLFETSTTQVTYSKLSSKTGAMSKDTFIDYCGLLERMDVICTLDAFDQNTLRGFPKKAKKILFQDPFIADVVGSWLVRERYADAVMNESTKVESIVASNFKRFAPVYYIKAQGEVDVVVVVGREFWPIEVKWTSQVRQRDLRQIKRLKNGTILTKQIVHGDIAGVPTNPVPLFLCETEPVLRRSMAGSDRIQ